MSFDVESCFTDQSNGNTILYYKGNIDPDVINQVLDSVEEKLINVNEQSRLRKKVYSVMVESLQNLYHHVDRVPEGFEDQSAEKYGIVAVKRVERGYKIMTGNFMRTSDVEKLREKISRINRSSHEEIKELYKFILNHKRITAKGGGGLGLVDIARKTGNKLDYDFLEYDNKCSFFFLKIHVKEEN